MKNAVVRVSKKLVSAPKRMRLKAGRATPSITAMIPVIAAAAFRILIAPALQKMFVSMITVKTTRRLAPPRTGFANNPILS